MGLAPGEEGEGAVPAVGTGDKEGEMEGDKEGEGSEPAGSGEDINSACSAFSGSSGCG